MLKIDWQSPNFRLKVWYGILIAVLVIFIGRLFYLQIIRHDHYRSAALQSQRKEYIIPAERGLIKAYDNSQPVPLVLNQKLYTLFADPLLVKNAETTAKEVANITSGDPAEYQKAVKTPNTRYVILAKKLSEQQKDKILALKLPGVATQPEEYRIYPQGSLAAHLLGYVDTEGQGKYGLEQALNPILKGKDGRLKAVTDAAGVPLLASKDNVLQKPQNGSEVVLTIDLSMQKQLEDILKEGLNRAKSSSGSALILDADSGAVKAMANWPTYNPAQYFEVKDSKIFNNASVSEPLEVGSIMKTLTAAAAFDLKVIKADTTYYDPGRWRLNDSEITNVESAGGPGRRSISDILYLSINTGATWMLMQMGGQTGVVNKTARERWHNYMTDHFQLGKPTNIEQGYEAGGHIPLPDEGYALELTYANTSFGQAMTATPLQMAAALASIVNGGIYYQPRLVDRITDKSGDIKIEPPKVVRRGVVSANVSNDIRNLLAEAIRKKFSSQGFRYLDFPAAYEVGGKTGTAQIANPAGGYYTDRYNGTYIGFVGGNKPQYVIAVLANQPKIGGYAGSVAAQPIFADIVKMLINNFDVTPKS